MSFDEAFGQQEQSADPLMTHLAAIASNPWGMLKRRWLWMLLAAVLGAAASAAAYVLIQPVYKAEATVLVSSQQIPEEFVRSTVEGLDSLANINALVGEMLSQSNLARLIEKFDLYPNDREDTELASIIVNMRESIEFAPQQHVQDRRRRNEASSIFVINYTYPSARKSADVANELAGSFINASVARRNAQAQTTTSFLEREKVRAKQELDEAKLQITNFQAKHRGAMPGDQETILRKLERLELHMQGLNEQIAVTQERLTQQRNEEGLANTPQAMLTELRLQLASELAVHTDEHPNVVTLRRRIEQLETEATEIAGLLAQSNAANRDRIAATERTLDGLRKRVETTEEEIFRLDGLAAQIPQNQEAFDALTGHAAILEENYLGFLRKVDDAQLAEELEHAQQGPRVSLLDKASPPQSPETSRQRFVIIGVVASIVLVLGVGLLFELLDPVVLSQDHFDQLGSAPMLGTIYSLQ